MCKQECPKKFNRDDRVPETVHFISLFVGSGSLQTVIISPDQRTEGAVDPGRGKATNPRGNWGCGGGRGQSPDDPRPLTCSKPRPNF